MTEPESPLPIIDWAYGKEIDTRSPGLMGELLHLFAQQLPDMQTAINQAFRENDLSELGDQLHKFHGSCVYCGLSRLKAVVVRCSDLLKQQQVPDQALLDKFNQGIEEVKLEMKEKGI
jgi:HPt (histidine-containing phosphotransfer) domain-containing protein